MAAVAANKGIAPERIAVQIKRETVSQSRWQTSFAVEIDLGSGLTHREQVILFNSARFCDVWKLLSGHLSFDYRWKAV